MTPTQAVTTHQPDKGVMSFVPFGAVDAIKLSVSIVQKLIAVPTKSGKTCSERDATRFIMLCQAQRLNPFAGDAYLVGYDTQNGPQFSLITAHQAFLKRAETCKEFEGMESGIIILVDDRLTKEREGDFHLPDEVVVGGWARVFRTGRRPTYRRIRLERFNTGFAQWKVDAAGMIVKCAESDALRSTFPTLLGGLYSEGEIIDINADPAKKVPASPTFAPQLPEGDPPSDPETEQQQETNRVSKAKGKSAEASNGQEKEPAKPDNYVKAVRSLMTLAGISEVDLIAYLQQTGQINDTVGTIGAMHEVAGVTLKKVHDGWADYHAGVKEWKQAEANLEKAGI